MKKHIIIIAVLLAVSVAAQNYCVGVGTANPTFKLDVNGNFRVQGEALFQDGATITGGLVADNILIAGTKVCREDGTNCPAAQGGQFTLTQTTRGAWTPTNVNTPDTCDGNKQQEYTCSASETKTCVDVKPLEAGVSNQESSLACKPDTLETNKNIKANGVCIGASCPVSEYLPKGTYGHCARTTGPFGSQCLSSLAPASCQNNDCVCPAGFQRVQTGAHQPLNEPWTLWYMCYKQ